MAYLKAGKTIYEAKVPTEHGLVGRTCGTSDRKLAHLIEDTARELANLHAWDVLQRVHDRTLTLAGLHAAWFRSGRKLHVLRMALEDVVAAPLIEQWRAQLESPARGVSRDTASHYRAAVYAFIEPDLRLSQITNVRIKRHLSSLKLAAGGVRKRAAGIADFCNWLVDHGHLPASPMIGVKLPSPASPRVTFLDTFDVFVLADALPPLHRELCLILAGTGLDLSTALELRARDVEGHRVTARGSKTEWRNRVVTVATFAREALAGLLRDRLPGDLLFPGISRWSASDEHREACLRLAVSYPQFAGYWLRDHRHTCAVRLARAGVPMRIVAEQLGHRDESLVARVYGRYAPTENERERWEHVASVRDAERQPPAQAPATSGSDHVSPASASLSPASNRDACTHNAGVAGSSPAPATGETAGPG